jgi:hypothetical protein
MVLVLLGGIAGCGESATQKEARKQQAQHAEQEYTAKEHETEEQEHPEIQPSSTYFRERGEAETKLHEEGLPPNTEVADKDEKAAEQVTKYGEGKEPAHTANWYHEDSGKLTEEEGALATKASCREKYGPEAQISNPVINPFTAEGSATCTSPSGEQWRVHSDIPRFAAERTPRLYRDGIASGDEKQAKLQEEGERLDKEREKEEQEHK